MFSLYDDLPPPKCTDGDDGGASVHDSSSTVQPTESSSNVQEKTKTVVQDESKNNTSPQDDKPAPTAQVQRSVASSVQMKHLQALKARLKTLQSSHTTQQHQSSASEDSHVTSSLEDPFFALGLYDCEHPNDYKQFCAEREASMQTYDVQTVNETRANATVQQAEQKTTSNSVASQAVIPVEELQQHSSTTMIQEMPPVDDELDGVPWEPPSWWKDPFVEDTEEEKDKEEYDDDDETPAVDDTLDGVPWTIPEGINDEQALALARAQATEFARAYVEDVKRRKKAQKKRRKRPQTLAEGVGGQMLQRMGWTPGHGLGRDEQGMIEPLRVVSKDSAHKIHSITATK